MERIYHTEIEAKARPAFESLKRAVKTRKEEDVQISIAAYDDLGALIREFTNEDFMRWRRSSSKSKQYDKAILQCVIGEAASEELIDRISMKNPYREYQTERKLRNALTTAMEEIDKAKTYKSVSNLAHDFGRRGDYKIILEAIYLTRECT